MSNDRDHRQLRRALRALIRQRGGTMLLRLHASGAEVRLRCSLRGTGGVAVEAHVQEAGLAAMSSALEPLRTECRRFGRELEPANPVGGDAGVPWTRAA